MARMARAVAPGFPHHITQGGIDGSRHFFIGDYFRQAAEVEKAWSKEKQVQCPWI
jgi:hypothetical protein